MGARIQEHGGVQYTRMGLDRMATKQMWDARHS